MAFSNKENTGYIPQNNSTKTHAGKEKALGSGYESGYKQDNAYANSIYSPGYDLFSSKAPTPDEQKTYDSFFKHESTLNTYTVENGDSLSAIAQKHNVTLTDLLLENGMRLLDMSTGKIEHKGKEVFIQPEMKLNIPNTGEQESMGWGYKDFDGNYRWFERESDDVIGFNGKLWIKFTDKRPIFNLFKAGLMDNIPEQPDNGEIKEVDIMTVFEMWLEEPSENILEFFSKIGLNVAYSIANSPYSLFTGQTIGGTPLTSDEKVEAFMDFVPGLITGGFTKTGQVIKTSKKGLARFNDFVKKSPGITSKEGLPKGMKWQERAGDLYTKNKIQVV